MRASASDANMSHHGMMIDQSSPISHDPQGSHAELCGMTVCGPFFEEKNATSIFMPVVSSVKYWVKNRPLVSAELDVSFKPPRS